MDDDDADDDEDEDDASSLPVLSTPSPSCRTASEGSAAAAAAAAAADDDDETASSDHIDDADMVAVLLSLVVLPICTVVPDAPKSSNISISSVTCAVCNLQAIIRGRCVNAMSIFSNAWPVTCASNANT